MARAPGSPRRGLLLEVRRLHVAARRVDLGSIVLHTIVTLYYCYYHHYHLFIIIIIIIIIIIAFIICVIMIAIMIVIMLIMTFMIIVSSFINKYTSIATPP